MLSLSRSVFNNLTPKKFMLMLFIVGLLDMVMLTVWTETVTRAKILESGMVTIINIFIWYYVLQKVVNNIENFNLVLVYALGCSIGTMIGTYFISLKQKWVEAAKKL